MESENVHMCNFLFEDKSGFGKMWCVYFYFVIQHFLSSYSQENEIWEPLVKEEWPEIEWNAYLLLTQAAVIEYSK